MEIVKLKLTPYAVKLSIVSVWRLDAHRTHKIKKRPARELVLYVARKMSPFTSRLVTVHFVCISIDTRASPFTCECRAMCVCWVSQITSNTIMALDLVAVL